MLPRKLILKVGIIVTLLPLMLNLSVIRTSGQEIKPISAPSSKQLEIIHKLKENSKGTAKITYGKKGVPTFVGGKLSTKKVNSPSDAIQVLEENRELFRMSSASSEMALKSNESDKIGSMFKFQQVYKEIPVYGHKLIVHSNRNGETTSINGDYDPEVNLQGIDVQAKLTKDQAIQVAKSTSGLTDVLRFDLQTAEQCIYNFDDRYHLAYAVKISTLEGEKPAYWAIFVDAINGEIINKYSLIKTVNATGSGTGVLNDTKVLNTDLINNLYYLRDITRPMHTNAGGGIITYSASNGKSETGAILTDTDNYWSDPAGIDAHYYAGVVYNYYLTKFQRDSFDGQGSNINSVVHYLTNYNNAFWNGSRMVYGDGDGVEFAPISGALDVVGHELTHAVIDYSAELDYHDQSGALNESFADVFGDLIENKSDNLWLIGEDVTTPKVSGDALRSMSNPTLYDQPDNMKDYVYLPNTEKGDNGGVHINSGIPNKAFYNFVTSAGVTRDDAGQVWYRALTQYLTPGSQFLDAGNATIEAAKDLFGSNSTQVLAVTNAWNDVGVVAVVDPDPDEPNESQLKFSSPTCSVSEGIGSAIVAVSREDGSTGTVSVNYATSDGTATAGEDYVATSGTLTFTPGEISKTLSLPIMNDTLVENSETVNLILSNPTEGASLGSPNQVILTIIDNDVAHGELEFSLPTYSISEAGPVATITVRRVNGSRGTVRVKYTTSNGTAIAGKDYSTKSGILTFAAGEVIKTFKVPLLNDKLEEGSETVNLTLSNPTGGATLGSLSQSTLTILDNDVAQQFQFSLPTYSISEAGPVATIIVRRENGSIGTARVNFATGNGTATAGKDYTAKSGTLPFTPGQVTKTFTVLILKDTVVENNETVNLILSNPTGGSILGGLSEAVLTIQDNSTIPKKEREQ